MKNMRQCSKNYLTTFGLSTICNEHMIKINGGCVMAGNAVSMENDLKIDVRRAAPDSGGHDR